MNDNLFIYTRQGNFQFKIENENIIECWIDYFSESKIKDSKKIFIQMEPDEYFHLNEQIIKKQSEYDYVFTFEPELLDKCKNSILFEYGTTWIKLTDNLNTSKIFSLSFVCGNKFHNYGHKLRQEIYYNQYKFNIPIDFYISSINPNKNDPFYIQKEIENKFNNKTLGEKKLCLFDSMFSICVENIKKDYYFSEKLIDCLLCKSIPVFYGCENIDNYFDINGFIIFNTLKELLDKTKDLTQEYYLDRIKYIEENYQKAIKWVNYNSRLIEKINSII